MPTIAEALIFIAVVQLQQAAVTCSFAVIRFGERVRPLRPPFRKRIAEEIT